MKRIVIADLDGTLAESKAAISDGMAQVLRDYIHAGGRFVVITGGLLSQITKQVVDNLDLDENYLEQLYLQPTSGTRMYTWNSRAKEWESVYAYDFTEEEERIILDAIEVVLEKKLVEFPEKLWGPQIEKRGSQIAFSALGQEAPVAEKKAWDPDKAKRKLLVAELQALLPDYRVAYGGSTTIDITKQGVDKGTGIQEFLKHTGFNLSDALFIGDALDPDGNDFPAYRTGIEVIKTSGPDQTREIILRQLSQ